MTSGSDPKESAHERAARLEAMLDEIKDEPGADAPDSDGADGASLGSGASHAASHAASQAGDAPDAPDAPHVQDAPAAAAELSTPDLDQLDADWGDVGADESAKHDLLASPRAAAVAARADLRTDPRNREPIKAEAPTSPKPVSAEEDMLSGYADDPDDDDDYSAKTVIGRVPDLVALTRNQADAPLRTNLRTPRASPVEVAEPQRDVPTIRPEPKVVIDAEADFSSVAPPAVIPPAAALPAQSLSEPPPDAPTRMARVVLESAPPPAARASRSVPPPDRDPAARAAEKAAADARAAQKKAKDRARIEAMRDRKKARAEAIARKQKAKQPRKSRPPPPPDSETEAGGSTMDSIPAPREGSGDVLVAAPRGGSTALARDWRRMAMLVVLVIAIGAIVLALVMRK